MGYQIFYWLHVIAYILWLLAFGGSLYYGIMAYVNNDAVKKRKLMWIERRITHWVGHAAAVGILISGIAMSVDSPANWGWLRIQLYPWLALKQVIFVIMLFLIGISMKRSSIFLNRMRAEKNVPGSDTSDKWAAAYRISLAVYILLTVNTMLGLMKPNLAF